MAQRRSARFTENGNQPQRYLDEYDELDEDWNSSASSGEADSSSEADDDDHAAKAARTAASRSKRTKRSNDRRKRKRKRTSRSGLTKADQQAAGADVTTDPLQGEMKQTKAIHAKQQAVVEQWEKDAVQELAQSILVEAQQYMQEESGMLGTMIQKLASAELTIGLCGQPGLGKTFLANQLAVDIKDLGAHPDLHGTLPGLSEKGAKGVTRQMRKYEWANKADVILEVEIRGQTVMYSVWELCSRAVQADGHMMPATFTPLLQDLYVMRQADLNVSRLCSELAVLRQVAADEVKCRAVIFQHKWKFGPGVTVIDFPGFDALLWTPAMKECLRGVDVIYYRGMRAVEGHAFKLLCDYGAFFQAAAHSGKPQCLVQFYMSGSDPGMLDNMSVADALLAIQRRQHQVDPELEQAEIQQEFDTVITEAFRNRAVLPHIVTEATRLTHFGNIHSNAIVVALTDDPHEREVQLVNALQQVRKKMSISQITDAIGRMSRVVNLMKERAARAIRTKTSRSSEAANLAHERTVLKAFDEVVKEEREVAQGAFESLCSDLAELIRQTIEHLELSTVMPFDEPVPMDLDMDGHSGAPAAAASASSAAVAASSSSSPSPSVVPVDSSVQFVVATLTHAVTEFFTDAKTVLLDEFINGCIENFAANKMKLDGFSRPHTRQRAKDAVVEAAVVDQFNRAANNGGGAGAAAAAAASSSPPALITAPTRIPTDELAGDGASVGDESLVESLKAHFEHKGSQMQDALSYISAQQITFVDAIVPRLTHLLQQAECSTGYADVSVFLDQVAHDVLRIIESECLHSPRDHFRHLAESALAELKVELASILQPLKVSEDVALDIQDQCSKFISRIRGLKGINARRDVEVLGIDHSLLHLVMPDSEDTINDLTAHFSKVVRARQQQHDLHQIKLAKQQRPNSRRAQAAAVRNAGAPFAVEKPRILEPAELEADLAELLGVAAGGAASSSSSSTSASVSASPARSTSRPKKRSHSQANAAHTVASFPVVTTRLVDSAALAPAIAAGAAAAADAPASPPCTAVYKLSAPLHNQLEAYARLSLNSGEVIKGGIQSKVLLPVVTLADYTDAQLQSDEDLVIDYMFEEASFLHIIATTPQQYPKLLARLQRTVGSKLLRPRETPRLQLKVLLVLPDHGLSSEFAFDLVKQFHQHYNFLWTATVSPFLRGVCADQVPFQVVRKCTLARTLYCNSMYTSKLWSTVKMRVRNFLRDNQDQIITCLMNQGAAAIPAMHLVMQLMSTDKSAGLHDRELSEERFNALNVMLAPNAADLDALAALKQSYHTLIDPYLHLSIVGFFPSLFLHKKLIPRFPHRHHVGSNRTACHDLTIIHSSAVRDAWYLPMWMLRNIDDVRIGQDVRTTYSRMVDAEKNLVTHSSSGKRASLQIINLNFGINTKV